MSDRPIIIAGHSHTVALGVPGSSAGYVTSQLIDLPGDSRFQGFVSDWPRPDSYLDDLANVAEGRIVAISWTGNQHLSAFLIVEPPVFDFALKARPDLPVEASLVVPELAVREVLGSSVVPLVYGLDRIIGRGGKPILLGTPPPAGDVAWIRSRLSLDPGFLKRIRDLGAEAGTIELPPPLLWLKSWLLLQQMLQEIADDFRIPFCPSPKEAETSEGFRRADYSARDLTHGNQAYGALVRHNILAIAQAMATGHALITEAGHASL